MGGFIKGLVVGTISFGLGFAVLSVVIPEDPVQMPLPDEAPVTGREAPVGGGAEPGSVAGSDTDTGAEMGADDPEMDAPEAPIAEEAQTAADAGDGAEMTDPLDEAAAPMPDTDVPSATNDAAPDAGDLVASEAEPSAVPADALTEEVETPEAPATPSEAEAPANNVPADAEAVQAEESMTEVVEEPVDQPEVADSGTDDRADPETIVEAETAETAVDPVVAPTTDMTADAIVEPQVESPTVSEQINGSVETRDPDSVAPAESTLPTVEPEAAVEAEGPSTEEAVAEEVTATSAPEPVSEASADQTVPDDAAARDRAVESLVEETAPEAIETAVESADPVAVDETPAAPAEAPAQTPIVETPSEALIVEEAPEIPASPEPTVSQASPLEDAPDAGVTDAQGNDAESNAGELPETAIPDTELSVAEAAVEQTEAEVVPTEASTLEASTPDAPVAEAPINETPAVEPPAEAAPIEIPAPEAAPEADAPLPAPEPTQTGDAEAPVEQEAAALPPPVQILPTATAGVAIRRGTEGSELEDDQTPQRRVPGVMVGRLPSIGAQETAAPEPVEEELPPVVEDTTGPAYVRNAALVDLTEETRPMGVVLTESAASQAAILDLLMPVTLAVNPFDAGAPARAAAYRRAGHEVVLIAADVPTLSTPSDLAVTLQTWLRDFPQAMGIMDAPIEGLASRRILARDMAQMMAPEGLAVIAQRGGLDSFLRAAGDAGLPAVSIYRVLDDGRQNAATIRRLIDRAAFEAQRQDNIVITGSADNAETMAALNGFASGSGRQGVTLTPVSVFFSTD